MSLENAVEHGSSSSSTRSKNSSLANTPSLKEDQRRIDAVFEELGPGQRLAVDAKRRFVKGTAIAYAKVLSQYNLFWYEEARDPLDYELQAELAKHYQGSMATGENLSP